MNKYIHIHMHFFQGQSMTMAECESPGFCRQSPGRVQGVIIVTQQLIFWRRNGGKPTN